MNVTTLKKCSPAFLGLLLIHLCFSSYGISLKNIPMEAAQSEEVCGETAFAFLNDDDDMSTADAASTCFLPEFTRWGWTTLLDFSEETGQSSYTLDIYAGAGQCDLSKGTDVGSVVVTYNADSSITFDYNLEGYVLSEAHIYVGVDEYPTHNGSETVAPGQYTYVDSEVGDLQDYSVTIPAEGTMLYVIVHGVTSHADCDDPNDDCPDTDDDGICDEDDICPGSDDSLDSDGDGIPDGCDDDCPDGDGDGVCDEDDLCPDNDDNLDSDGDGIPDGCDDDCPDSDGDGVCDEDDLCPDNDDNIDSDGDGIPDGCDIDVCPDSDSDGVCDANDICPGHNDNADNDGDGIPDGCDNGAFEAPAFDAYPVPFENEINLRYSFDYETSVNIEVFDIKGVKLGRIENNNYTRGTTGITKFDLSYAGDQLLFVRLSTKKGQLTKKIVSFKSRPIDN